MVDRRYYTVTQSPTLNLSTPSAGRGANPIPYGGGGMGMIGNFAARVLGQIDPYARDGGLIRGLAAGLGGVSSDRAAIRQAQLQNLNSAELADQARAAGMPVGQYTTLSSDDLKNMYGIQGLSNARGTINSILPPDAQQLPEGPVPEGIISPAFSTYGTIKSKQIDDQGRTDDANNRTALLKRLIPAQRQFDQGDQQAAYDTLQQNLPPIPDSATLGEATKFLENNQQLNRNEKNSKAAEQYASADEHTAAAEEHRDTVRTLNPARADEARGAGAASRAAAKLSGSKSTETDINTGASAGFVKTMPDDLKVEVDNLAKVNKTFAIRIRAAFQAGGEAAALKVISGGITKEDRRGDRKMDQQVSAPQTKGPPVNTSKLGKLNAMLKGQ